MSQQINLYDPALERQRDWLALHFVVGLAVVLTVVVGVTGYLARGDLPVLTIQAATGESQIKAARDQVTALGQQAANRKHNPLVAQELAARQMLLAVRSEVLATLQQGLAPTAGSFADYLRGLSRQTIPGLWLRMFAVNAASGGMEIHGRTTNPALLPEYLRRLNQEPAFQGRAFASLKLDTGKPATPAGTTATSTVAVAHAAPFHEFMLIPVKSGAAQLSQNALPAGVSGGPG